MDDRELIYRLALLTIPKVGAVQAKNILSYCGSGKAVFDMGSNGLKNIPGIADLMVDHILNQGHEQAEEELRKIRSDGIRPLFYLDDDYPVRLRNIHDCPFFLFCRGKMDLNPRRSLAIVGTRSVTERGRLFSEQLVEDLVPYNPTIISGLAYGTDVTAHRAAVRYGLQTIGVMGTGFHRIYPYEHRGIAEKMESNGGLVTEFLYDEGADQMHFPMRNRVIAGLSDAVLVIESAERGGSMITADLAFGYGREVYAVPGRVDDKRSKGCNLLIKEQGAGLIESAEDLARALEWEPVDEQKVKQTTLFVELTGEEERVVGILESEREIGADRLSELLDLPSSELANILLSLEFKGVIKALPGDRYRIIR